MNEMALRRRISVLLVTAFLSVMGGFATTAFGFADHADARRSHEPVQSTDR